MRKVGFALLGVIALAVAAYVFWPRETVVDDTPIAASPVPDVELVRSTDALTGDGGVMTIAGVVYDEVTMQNVPYATVRLFASAPDFETLECSICHQLAMMCSDASTARQLHEAVRSGAIAPPKTLAEVTTDAQGRFTIENAPVGSIVVAMVQGKMHAQESVDAVDHFALSLRNVEPLALHAVDPDNVPLPSARFTLYEPLTGTLQTFRADDEGTARLSSADPFAWVMIEADGTLPVSRPLEQDSVVVLAAPRTLIIKTRYAGEPIDADVSMELHQRQRTWKTKNGEVRIEGLPWAYYSVTAQSGSLVSEERGADLNQLETEIVFELRQSAKLLVTVLSSSGDPIETVNGQLSGDGFDVSKTAENGALLIFGPVVEGDADLFISAEGHVDVRRSIDLKPGETQLEIIMSEPAKLTGTVLKADGTPAESVRVGVGENDEETEIAFTDETGAFSVDLPYEGTFTLHAESSKYGSVTGVAKLPGPKPVLKLQERGVLEVLLLDVDGKPVEPDCMVRSNVDARLLWVDDWTEGGPGRLAGIEGGRYTISKNTPGHLPIEREVDIVEGRVVKVTLQLERGAALTGRVIDSRGKPLPEATVLLTTASADYGRTESDGTFEIAGLVAGEAEVWAVGKSGVESPHVKLEIPARDVVLTVPEALRVKGRVVDEKGSPIAKFDVNGTAFNAPDGRFEVEAPQHMLQVSADGYEQEYIAEVAADAGDVKLKPQATLEGEVVDEQGRGLSGVYVQLSMEMMPVTTDGRGAFKLPIDPELEQEVIASRGALSGRAPAKHGTRVRITLQSGTVVAGRVVGADGRGVRTGVTALSRDFPKPMLFETDVDGRFEATLAQGIWLFSARSSRAQRTVDVKGARIEVVLGDAPGTCGFTATASAALDNVWLMAK
ncbi:MAG: carboxypeptidase regulatory-like domain-containing protein, partial [Archangium sp.]